MFQPSSLSVISRFPSPPCSFLYLPMQGGRVWCQYSAWIQETFLGLGLKSFNGKSSLCTVRFKWMAEVMAELLVKALVFLSRGNLSTCWGWWAAQVDSSAAVWVMLPPLLTGTINHRQTKWLTDWQPDRHTQAGRQADCQAGRLSGRQADRY